MAEFERRLATIAVDHWGGRSTHTVLVVGETPKRYLVRVPEGSEEVVILPHRRRICGDACAYVPKYSVKFIEGSKDNA